MERRRMERSSLQTEVMQMVPDLEGHENMFQDEEVKWYKKTKKVRGWSIEEVRNKPSCRLEEDTEQMMMNGEV